MNIGIKPRHNIGVVGRIGTAIANNILKSGFSLVVYNRTSDKTSPLVEAGATKATSPKEVAVKSGIVITSLRDDIPNLVKEYQLEQAVNNYRSYGSSLFRASFLIIAFLSTLGKVLSVFTVTPTLEMLPSAASKCFPPTSSK